MMSGVLALLCFGVVVSGLCGIALIERATRLSGVRERPDIRAPRAAWGGELVPPPAHYAMARALASAARQARGRTFVEDASTSLRRFSRVLALLATSSAIAIVPFASRWHGQAGGRALVAVDLDYGLGVIVFLILLAGLAQAATGLAERSLWARLGALRIAGQSLIGVALLLWVLAPLVLATASLRPHDLVLDQQGTFAPLAFLSDRFIGAAATTLEAFRLPNWFVFRQPLTALLIVPTLGLLLQRYSVHVAMHDTSGMSGIGLDSDPSDVYWRGLESRLASLLAAVFFVAFFLGAGSIPYFDPTASLETARATIGVGVPAALWLLVEAGVFVAKVGVVLHLGSLLRRSTGRARTDQSLRTMTRRLIPLAWANLLLVSAVSMLGSSGAEALR